jgi:4-amino-4-deoxy-L-arabinose transferase-like glycosyltransferase
MTGVAIAPRAAPGDHGDGAPDSGRQRRWLLAILGLGLLLRLAWVVYASRDPAGLNDPHTYLIASRTLADGDGYRFIIDGSPTAYFPIGYPAFVTLVTWLNDITPLSDVPKTVGVLQALIGTASIWLVWRIAGRLFGARTALVAAAIMAVFPGLLLYSAPLLSETLFVAIELAAIAVVVERPWDAGTPSRRRLVAFGVLSALAALVRPQGLLLVVALAIGLAAARFGWRRSLAPRSRGMPSSRSRPTPATTSAWATTRAPRARSRSTRAASTSSSSSSTRTR